MILGLIVGARTAALAVKEQFEYPADLVTAFLVAVRHSDVVPFDSRSSEGGRVPAGRGDTVPCRDGVPTLRTAECRQCHFSPVRGMSARPAASTDRGPAITLPPDAP